MVTNARSSPPAAQPFVTPAEPAPGRAKLRLGVLHASAEDVETIRGFARRCLDMNDAFPWIFVEQPPFDATLVEAGSPYAAGLAMLNLDQLAVLIGEPASPDDENTLTRPLTFSKFEYFFTQRAFNIFSANASTATPDAATPTYRLTKFPSASFLQKGPLRIRIAAILAKGPMELAKIAELARARPDICARALATFEDAGFAGRLGATGPAVAPAAETAAEAQAPQPPPKPRPTTKQRAPERMQERVPERMQERMQERVTEPPAPKSAPAEAPTIDGVFIEEAIIEPPPPTPASPPPANSAPPKPSFLDALRRRLAL